MGVGAIHLCGFLGVVGFGRWGGRNDAIGKKGGRCASLELDEIHFYLYIEKPGSMFEEAIL